MNPPPRRAEPVDETYYDGPFARPARFLLRHGVRPNHFTFAQAPLMAFQIWAAYMGWAWAFALTAIPIIVLDGGDGILARVGGLTSKAGARLDATFDVLGIATVMWGAAQFHPGHWLLFAILFAGNLLLYGQNRLVGEKAVSYVRGPVLTVVAFPEVLDLGLFVSTASLLWVMVWRLPETLRAVFGHRPHTATLA